VERAAAAQLAHGKAVAAPDVPQVQLLALIKPIAMLVVQ